MIHTPMKRNLNLARWPITTLKLLLLTILSAALVQLIMLFYSIYHQATQY